MTGASRGIGRASALALAKAGARVAVHVAGAWGLWGHAHSNEEIIAAAAPRSPSFVVSPQPSSLLAAARISQKGKIA